MGAPGGVHEVAPTEPSVFLAYGPGSADRLAAVLAGWTKRPCHIITVNDYLAGRDAGIMRPVYEALGLTVGCVVHGMEPDARRAVLARECARTPLGETLVGKLLFRQQLVEQGLERFGGFGVRRKLASELRPRMLAPDKMPERPGLQFSRGVRPIHLLFGALAGRKMFHLLVFRRLGGRRW